MSAVAVCVPLTDLVVGSDHAPGMDMAHVRRLVAGDMVDTRPIEVRLLACGHLEIINGRHRYFAALINGDLSINVSVKA